MIERTTNLDAVISGIFWTAVVMLYAVAAMLMLYGAPHAGIIVAEIACGVSAYAAVRHIKIYAVRGCELLRRVDARIESGRHSEVPLQRIH